MVPLRFVTLMKLEEVELILGLHHLSNDAQINASTHADYCPNNGHFIGDGSDLRHERPVDFEGVEGKLSEVAQAGVACAEVIDSHLYSPFP